VTIPEGTVMIGALFLTFGSISRIFNSL
jgi:hypothetical protein